MKIRKLLAAACGCFALLLGTTAAHAAETTVALTGETSVTVDGTVVESPVPNSVASVNGTHYADLAAALNAAVAAKNATVEIVDDITFEAGDTWTPVRIGSDKTLVVNGNGKTIKNLPGCLFGTTHESEMQTGSSLTMTNLKFVNPKVRVNKPAPNGESHLPLSSWPKPMAWTRRWRRSKSRARTCVAAMTVTRRASSAGATMSLFRT